MFRSIVLGAACAVAAAAALATASPAATTDDPPPKFNPPKGYYLALGDSITYGFQSSKFFAGLPPAAFDTGYVDVFAARLRSIRPGITVVNHGCPGESTSVFIGGPCLFNLLGLPLHDAFAGSQLDAATSFLTAHPGQVSPITLHLFGNDVLEFVASCGGDFDCIQRNAPVAIAQLATRMGVILDALRAVAPDAEIIVIGGWGLLLAESDPLIQAANAAIAAVAGRQRAVFVDAAPVFNPPGEEARMSAICALTLLCSEGDGHPSDAGYRALAGLVFDASGYARLEG